MKLHAIVLAAASALALGTASAAVYSDAVGDLGTGPAGNNNVDIKSVTVTNDATNLIFQVQLNADIVATNWGKYMVGIDSAPGGDPSGNGWSRPIGMSSGMDYWVGTWVDSGGGAELRNWNGSSWNLQLASYNSNMSGPSMLGDTETITVPLAALGLAGGGTIAFDVYSSGGGGGDGAVDALGLSTPSIQQWGDAYNSGQNVLSYTVVVPEPASLSLLGLGGLALVRRRK